MRVLLITETLLRDDNNVGNSYSNIFGGIENIEIQNVCCQQGKSLNSIAKKSFQISEKLILRSLLHKSEQAGLVEDLTDQEVQTEKKPKEKLQNQKISAGQKLYHLAKIVRFQFFFWIRDLIWKTGRWKTALLREFLDDCQPDIIFAQLQDKMYLNELIVFIKDYVKVPLVAYAWDDIYSLKQFHISPFWWLDRLMQRRKIRETVRRCEKIYTISLEQKEEYEQYFRKPCSILYKGYSFEGQELRQEGVRREPLKIVYTGNLYGGRWKTIAALCSALKQINSSGTVMELYIYSATPLLKRQIRKLSVEGSSHFCGGISSAEVQKVQREADILLHAEDFGWKGSLTTRLSFSTKIVDYFKEQKCILAMGSERCASIKYLERYDSAVVITDKREILPVAARLAEAPELIEHYREKAWNCGAKNHEIRDIQRDLQRDLTQLSEKWER